MQHPSLTSPYNYNDSLREQIQAMSSFQTNLTHFFQHRDQQLSLRSSKVTQATKLAHQETFKIKQILTQFVQDCRTEWVMIWQQFFSIFQKIADLYQIKIEKLQSTLHEKDMLIQTLQFERKSLRQQSKYNPPSLQQTHLYRQIEKSSNRTDQYENFNDKTNRRVKISDVIAEYTQSSSSVVSMNHQTSFGEAVTEERQSSEHIESQAPIVLMEIAQHLNRQSMSTHPIFLSQKHNKYSQRMVGDNCFEMSAIMSENSSEGVSPQKGLKFKKYSSKANKENSLVYSKRLKENDQRKRTNYYTKNAKSYESQVLSSACKLDQLRKNLLQRRRSEHLL